MFSDLGVDTVTLSSLNSASALLQVVCSPMLGKLGDRYGARTMLLISIVSSASGQLMAGLATGFGMLVISKILFVGQDVRLGEK